MTNFDDYTNENNTEHNLKWPEHNLKWPSDHLFRMLITGGSGLGKTNPLSKLINKQPDIDKIYLYEKDLYEVKYNT